MLPIQEMEDSCCCLATVYHVEYATDSTMSVCAVCVFTMKVYACNCACMSVCGTAPDNRTLCLSQSPILAALGRPRPGPVSWQRNVREWAFPIKATLFQGPVTACALVFILSLPEPKWAASSQADPQPLMALP